MESESETPSINWPDSGRNVPSQASHSQNNLNGTDPEEESRSEVNGTHRTAVANNVEGGIENANRSFLTHQEWSILKRECVRLRTFDDRFSADFLSPLALAGAGFFYLGSADQVQCAFCRGVIGDWEVNDDPRREHLRLFPSCPFILGLPVGNVSGGEPPTPVPSLLERSGSLPVNSSRGRGFDVSTRFTPQFSDAIPDTDLDSHINSELNGLNGESLEELGITKHRAPRYAMYATKDARLKSFNHWPSHLKQTPLMMAQAGFFYLGVHDHVKCFHCDGGLRNWEPNDDPWLEHAQWFPHCGYLILVKGEDYIKQVAESAPSPSGAMRCSRWNPPPLPLVACPRSAPREVSEEELCTLLDSVIAQTVLNMGVDVSRVKQAMQYKIRTTGHAFNTVDSLLEAAIEVQHYSEHRHALEDTNYETVEWARSRPSTTTNTTDTTTSNSLSESSSWEDATVPEPIPSSDSLASTLSVRPEVSMELVEETVVEAEGTPPVSEETQCPSPKRNDESHASLPSSETNRTQVLEEEIRRLKEARLCKVCLDEDVSVAYIPCGHIVTCVLCAAALDQCPLCRNNIKGTVRVFFS